MNRQRRKFSRKVERRKLTSALKQFSDGKNVDKVDIERLESFGLIENNELTYAGRTLITEQEAIERKQAVANINLIFDNPSSDKAVGTHGTVKEISAFLKQSGLQKLLEKQTLNEAEFLELKSKDASFSKRFGFSVIQHKMIKILDPDNLDNEFLRTLAREIPPTIVRGDDLEKTVVDVYKSTFSDYKSRIKSHINRTINASDYSKLYDCVEKIEPVFTKSWFTTDEFQSCAGLVLTARTDLLFNSQSLQDKHKLLDVINAFEGKKYFAYTQAKKKAFVSKTLELFKTHYASLTNPTEKRGSLVNLSKFFEFSKTTSSSYFSDFTDCIAELVFGSVNSSAALEEALTIVNDVRNRDLHVAVDVQTKKYFDNLCQGKTVFKKAEIFSPYVEVMRKLSIDNLISSDVKTEIVKFRFESIKLNYSSFTYAKKASQLKEFYELSKSFNCDAVTDIAELVISDVSDPKSLDEAFGLASVTSSFVLRATSNQVKTYFEKMCKGKTVTKQAELCLPYVDLIRKESMNDVISDDVKSEIVTSSFESIKSNYSSLTYAKKVSQFKYLVGLAAYFKCSVADDVASLVFSDASSPKTLETAIALSLEAGIDKSTSEKVKEYFKNLCKGKTEKEKIKSCLEYADLIKTQDYQSILPDAVKNTADLAEKAFFASLFPSQTDGIIADYDSFKKKIPSLESESVMFVDLLAEVDRPIFEKFSRYIQNNGSVRLDATRKRIKIVNSAKYSSVDMTNFVQAAVFLSYLSAKEKGEAVVYDASAVYTRAIKTSDVEFKFGDAVPKEEPDLPKYKFSYNPSLIISNDEDEDRERRRAKTGRKKDELFYYSNSLESKLNNEYIIKDKILNKYSSNIEDFYKFDSNIFGKKKF